MCCHHQFNFIDLLCFGFYDGVVIVVYGCGEGMLRFNLINNRRKIMPPYKFWEIKNKAYLAKLELELGKKETNY